MSDSLEDQLLKLGFKRAERKPEPPPARRSDGPGAKPDAHAGKPLPHGSRPPARADAQRQQQRQRREGNGRPSGAEVDLARAYALRAQTERAERERAEREAQERARERKERKAKLAALLDGKALNDASAEVARHFPHGDKIRRVYVTPEQLVRLNRGELGVVQLQGRYLLLSRDIALAAGAIWAEALALLPDPDAPSEDDIPADLIW
ncbi:MAG TPA: DUF2058 family protein [Candidatus Saccharimonadia bacterium]|nr:DUF2058 family protein [Candidatus Saccharimonadia bacterium]